MKMERERERVEKENAKEKEDGIRRKLKEILLGKRKEVRSI